MQTEIRSLFKRLLYFPILKASAGTETLRSTWIIPILVGVFLGPGYAQTTKPTFVEKLGMSAIRLQRAQERLDRAVSSRTVGSAVGLIARSGKIVFHKSVGEIGPGDKMPIDAIMRTASITKPVTAVAVLILYERGELQLSDPVEKYIPEFRDLKVNVASEDDKRVELVSADRPITIYDLLTHQAGLVSSYDILDKYYSEANTNLEFALALAKMPLRFQPGSKYEYGPSYDILATIVEKIAAKKYDKFLSEEVLAPLKMNDSYFFVPPSRQSRLAAQYRKDSNGNLVMFRARGQEETPVEFFSGGGGLRSTVSDYFRFAQFLLNEGTLDGVRLLSPKSVRLMTTDHVGIKYPDRGFGWGFGVEVRTESSGLDIGTAGSYGWNGGTGTQFLVDPIERLVVIIFAPTIPRTPGVNELRQGFINDAYQSIVRSHDIR